MENMYFRFQKFRVPGVSRVSRLSVECFEFKEFQRSKFLAIFPVKIFLKREKRKKIWISKVSNFETLSGCEKRKKIRLRPPFLVFGMMRSLWMDRFVRRSTTNEQFRWNRVRLLSLLPSLSLSHSFSQLSAISICQSVSLSFPFVCLSISVSVSLLSNLRLDLLNPHTVHLTYTFIRIKTRW